MASVKQWQVPVAQLKASVPAMPTVLVIDDDRSVSHLVRSAFEEVAVDVISAESTDNGLRVCREADPDVVLLDMFLPSANGIESFQKLRSLDPKRPVILMTADTDSEHAIEATMLGAHDYLIKPLELRRIREIVGTALQTRRMMRTPVQIPLDHDVQPADHLVGKSRGMLDVYKAIGRVAPEDVTTLIRGESGTGKELVARAIYHHSLRKDRPFLAVNSAALPDTLLESELFGHEKGSFTGADRRRIGKFEQCDGGTIFLDEVGDMSPVVQGKILRLLQKQEFERVGGNETIRTNVRIIAATNRDLDALVDAGAFREDLYYRLNGFTIHLPPLRERGNDIVLLLEYFLGRLGHELDRQHVEGISPDAVEILMNYDWPGNVRELESVVRQSLLNASGPVIVPACLPQELFSTATGDAGAVSARSASDSDETDPSSDLGPLVESLLAEGSTGVYAEALRAMERFVITRVLRETHGNQSQTAKILGITRGKVADRIRTFGISLEQAVTVADKRG